MYLTLMERNRGVESRSWVTVLVFIYTSLLRVSPCSAKYTYERRACENNPSQNAVETNNATRSAQIKPSGNQIVPAAITDRIATAAG